MLRSQFQKGGVRRDVLFFDRYLLFSSYRETCKLLVQGSCNMQFEKPRKQRNYFTNSCSINSRDRE